MEPPTLPLRVRPPREGARKLGAARRFLMSVPAPTGLSLRVNGRTHVVPAAAHDAPLLLVLRNDLGLNGPKYGCGLGECGTCTVLVNGVAARACAIPAGGVAGREITTLEGLGQRSCLHPVQQAFIDEQAAQCGYCLNGMVLMAAALLARNPAPTEDDVRRELSGNLCRCGAHVEIVRAMMRAAAFGASSASSPGAAAGGVTSPALRQMAGREGAP